MTTYLTLSRSIIRFNRAKHHAAVVIAGGRPKIDSGQPTEPHSLTHPSPIFLHMPSHTPSPHISSNISSYHPPISSRLAFCLSSNVITMLASRLPTASILQRDFGRICADVDPCTGRSSKRSYTNGEKNSPLHVVLAVRSLLSINDSQ